MDKLPRMDKMPEMGKRPRMDETITNAKNSKLGTLNNMAILAKMSRLANGLNDQGG